MPYQLGAKSKRRLGTCHPVLQEIVRGAILYTPMDFTVLYGWRSEEEQNALFEEGRSKLRWPESKHNHVGLGGSPLSLAVDIAPWYPEPLHVRWNQPEEFRWLAGFVMGIGEPIARQSGFTLRWGGDWDRDGDHRDQTFMDLPHLELVETANARSAP